MGDAVPPNGSALDSLHDSAMLGAGCAIQSATVVQNAAICTEHFRLRLRVAAFGPSSPGQFVHIGRHQSVNPVLNGMCAERPMREGPLLRRAFSIAGLRRAAGGVELDVIYRVVGAGTRWMSTLPPGDVLSVLGPQGNHFPIHPDRLHAWLIAGGVGVPPMLWLAEALRAAQRETIAFCGAQRRDLLALTIDGSCPLDPSARRAVLSAAEFRLHGAAVIVSTDDGSIGFRGHVGQALTAYAEASRHNPQEVVVYTCGPERMMHFVAEFCAKRGLLAYACMERAMACGTGMCQSCVVPVRDEADVEGWRYRLCCTDGPVFDASSILWNPPR
ncbi:MAG: dihydroorotate dehydrogenase electron transfer subunit [Planctomycetota bacterium]